MDWLLLLVSRRPQSVVQQPPRRQHPSPDHLEPFEAQRRVVEVGLEEERERFAIDGLRVERAEQSLEIDRRQRRAIRLLERPGIEHDPDAPDRRRWGALAEPSSPMFGHERQCELESRLRSSSARS